MSCLPRSPVRKRGTERGGDKSKGGKEASEQTEEDEPSGLALRSPLCLPPLVPPITILWGQPLEGPYDVNTIERPPTMIPPKTVREVVVFLLLRSTRPCGQRPGLLTAQGRIT